MTMSAHKRIRIEHDEFPESPRAWCNIGTMVCWHRLYSLGDEQPSKDPDEYLLEVAEEFSPGITERVEAECERLTDKAGRVDLLTDEQRHELWRDIDAAFDRHLDRHLHPNIIMLPLYLYDHSGLSMNTGGFSCPWDSGQVGFIFVRISDVKKEFGWRVLTAKRREQVLDYLRNEVEVYDQYLRGDVWGFVVEERTPDGEWEESDSCWGFYGSDPFENGMSGHINEEDHVLLRLAADKLHDR